MPLAWLFERFGEGLGDDAIVWRDGVTRYDALLARIEQARAFLADRGIEPGQSVLLDADFSPGAVAMLLAAIANRNIVVPVASHVVADRRRLAEIAECSAHLRVTDDDRYECDALPHAVSHELLRQIVDAGVPGMVLFSSGSTGEPKATVHRMDHLIERFKKPRHRQRIITFLLFDHIGGFNTLMYTLANRGCVITLEARDAKTVCRAIEQHRAEVLPTSPTFLNLLLMSGEHEKHDLSSLKVINYATEVMPQSTLDRLAAAFPGVTLHQSYGLSEIGIMRTKSRDNDSTWVAVGGEGYETRVVDGMLEVKAHSSMIGYLNAPSPFTDDGWFMTGDEVEVDGDWLRFKGRKSDIINVGGEKVYPAEVESVVMQVDNIADVTVTKQPHPFTGHIVVAEVSLDHDEDLKAVAARVRKHCFAHLPSYKVPVKIELAETSRISERFKKRRPIEG